MAACNTTSNKESAKPAVNTKGVRTMTLYWDTLLTFCGTLAAWRTSWSQPNTKWGLTRSTHTWASEESLVYNAGRTPNQGHRDPWQNATYWLQRDTRTWPPTGSYMAWHMMDSDNGCTLGDAVHTGRAGYGHHASRVSVISSLVNSSSAADLEFLFSSNK